MAIWTTTPWTLPANRAVALHPQFAYSVVEFELGGGPRTADVGRRADQAGDQQARGDDWTVIAQAKGEALEHLALQHPFYDRQVPVILGDHVTLDTGTGAVHTSPGHGLDDYIVGRRYDLEIDNPVGGDGRFLPDTPLFAGEQVFDANAHIIKVLIENGPLAEGRALPSFLSALLAPQDAGDLSRDAAVVHQHGTGGAAQGRARSDHDMSTGCRPGASSASPA